MSQPTFAELLAMPGVVEECELRGRFGFMAYHGGALEETTDVIARQAALASGASYYGVLQPESLLVHLPSILVTPDQSPPLEAFLDHVDVVVTVHGFGRRPLFTSILLGGRNRGSRLTSPHTCERHCPSTRSSTTWSSIPIELQGTHARNPVNLPPDAGVQLELPPRARGCGPIWNDWEGGLVPHDPDTDRHPRRGGVDRDGQGRSAADRPSSTAG